MDPPDELFRTVGERLAPYKLPLILGGISVFSLSVALAILVRQAAVREPLQIVVSESTASASAPQGIVVDISGAVVNPGVKRVSFDARLIDVIQVSGGYTADVDREKIEKTMNLAMKVKDGMKIYIPRLSAQTSHNKESAESVDSETSHNLVEDAVGSMTVSINMASLSDLVNLPGVGPVTAEKIIAGRPYSDIQELVTKKILGSKLFEKLKSQLSL